MLVQDIAMLDGNIHSNWRSTLDQTTHLATGTLSQQYCPWSDIQQPIGFRAMVNNERSKEKTNVPLIGACLERNIRLGNMSKA